MTSQVRFTNETVDGVTVLTVHGELDLANIDELKLSLEKACDKKGDGLVVDLTKTSYFDSRTIALLAEFGNTLRVRRQRLALAVAPEGFAARILQISGLPQIVPAFATISEAVQSIKQPAGT